MVEKFITLSRKIAVPFLIMGALFAGLFLIAPHAHAAVGTNQQMNFQGRLFNAQGAVVPDGYYNIQFKIYQDGDGQTAGDTTGSPAGSLKWTESWLNNNSQGVQVKNGFISVQLGSITAFGSNVNWNSDTLWLSMNIGNTNTTCTPFTSCGGDGEMVPMKRLSSAAYALNSSQLGGLSSAQFVQFAQGLQTDATTNTSSIAINKTGTGNLLQLQSSSADAFVVNNSGDVSFGAAANHTISVATSAAGIAGKNLTIAAGAANISGAGAAGGNLTLQGGNAAGTGNNNGGNITLAGGTGTGTGAQGLVSLSASAYTAVTNTACAANCTLTQANVDAYGTVMVSASTGGITMTLPAPTNSTAGRIIYVTTLAGSQDFVLNANSGGSTVSVAMRQNTTATMIWNGTAWTPGGASNATTLQAVYNNGANPATTPEIKLDSTHGTIDIQDADTSLGTDILNVRGSNAGGLGTVLFGVSSTGRVTVQNTADQASSFRALNANGDYVLNINSSNNYIVNNSITNPNNAIANASFETGGAITSGEEGWFGPAQASIVNDSANAHASNYELQVTPNSSNIDVYGGTYYEVRPGDNLYLEAWAKASATANGTAGIQITWYDKDKANPSYSTDYASALGTSYSLKSVNATVPSGKYFARISATVRSTATTGTYYFDDFFMRKSSEAAPMTLRNSIDSSSAFLIQSAGSSQTLFTADTTNNLVKIGDNTGTDTATTLLVLDGATANPTTNLASKNGGLFYRSDTNSLKAVIGGSVVDICTTAVTCAGYSASASSSIQLQAGTPGTVQTGNFNISGVGILSQLQTQDQSGASTNSSNLVIRTGNATGTTSNSGNLTLDVGTATGSLGTISIGHSGVATTMGGTLNIQGSNALALGASSSADGSILFRNSVGSNTVTLKAAGSNPTSSYVLSLPQNLGSSGDCLKDTGSGALGFSNCSAGTTTNIQNTYDNSSSPATVTLANAKDLVFTAQDTATDPNVLINLNCVTCSTTGGTSDGRFAIRNSGTDVFTVLPNGGGIKLNGNVTVGSNSPTSTTQTNFQLGSFTGAGGENTCTTSVNQGAMYYNTTSSTIRACINGGWSDVTNPEALGLMSYGIVPSSGGASGAYDLAATVTPGASGPCKVSWASTTTVTWQTCVVYSGGKRSQVTAGTVTIGTTTTNIWRHLCIDATTGQPALTAASSSATANMPAFSTTSPVVCLADIKGSTTSAGQVAQIYDTRTFTSTLKEAITVSTAVELGMLADAGPSGIVPAASASQKMYATVVATDGSTSSTTPNAIVATVGPAWVKAISGSAGNFVIASTTSGYAATNTAIPNNSFYYSAGNTRTSYAATCTAASNCAGSLYVNFIVR